MNLSDFTYLLNKPNTINEAQINDLTKILDEFPYFQSARSLYLKGLFKQDSFKYNTTLKTTAAYTTDRTVLFDFITSDHFVSIQKDDLKEEEIEVLEIPATETNTISESRSEISENTLEKSILSSIHESEQDKEDSAVKNNPEDILPPENQIAVAASETQFAEEKLDIEKPISFKGNETHSFQEWLQLSRLKPIDRNKETVSENSLDEKNLVSKLDIIDKFIETNPKIPPIKEDTSPPSYTSKAEDTSYLMTETLAKVYLEQKKYIKAIQAYEILILKYPEKSSLFADRISDIKILQQNNNK